MTTHNFSIEDLAMSLIVRLDRNNIFPPMLNNPESFLSPTDNLTNLSFRRPKRSPNAFLVCRRNVHEEATRKGTFNMRVISKVTGILWKNASAEEKDVYKKLADRVYEIHYKRTSSIYKKMTVSSLKERASYKPYYSFPIQLSTASTAPPPTSPQIETSIGPIVPIGPLIPVGTVGHVGPVGSGSTSVSTSAPPPSLPLPLTSTLYPSTPYNNTFNFEIPNNGYISLNNLNHQPNNIDYNSYTEINGQIIPNNYHHQQQQQQTEQNQLLYLYNNIFSFNNQ
ncbi:unnamed protein product [Rhizophagus irregularis]|uniref:MATA-HMG n=1 Tax=Rhizophagus irregularis TaxID=588596 RepID=A0A1B1EVH0_9GLOM|nr:MATA-HMG [Rhizophagus irregularis]PKY52434.1 hypothetical protein RhiirA4_470065 [Rhizophagus irregularis]CAB4403988.1 unnamed protein product [Rhizophagus irregularis]CAB4404694.1 unnamed protein product [Rhizophagus irregularis]